MIKKILLVSALVLSACGYTAVYEKTAHQMQQVYIGKVQVAMNDRLPGERRVAQLVNRRLSQVFTGVEGDPYTLNLSMEEGRRTLAVLRDSTEDRFEVALSGRVDLVDSKGVTVFTKNVVSSAPYNVESSPYSTEAGKDRARQSAAESLTTDVIQSISFFLHGQK